MCKIKTFIVKPLSSKKENISLLVSFILIILISGIILKIRYQPKYEQTILENEISSYSALNSIELGIYSDIKNSLFDITMMYDQDGEVPNIETLQEEAIPPYVEDTTWEQRGFIDWTYFKHDDHTYYLGISDNVNKIGTFLIELNMKDIEASKIFFTKENFPIESFKKDMDNYAGLFKKIVPYTGKEERKKFKGE